MCNFAASRIGNCADVTHIFLTKNLSSHLAMRAPDRFISR